MLLLHGAEASLLMLITGMASEPAHATGPRVTGLLFATDKDQIHAVDIPPFITPKEELGGVSIEIVDRVLDVGKINMAVNMLPLQRMARYYLEEENAIAIMGDHFDFSPEQREHLIIIPITITPEYYVYHRQHYPQGLEWRGTLSTLKGKRYGAHAGENAKPYEQAGIAVSYGRTGALIKQLINGEIDFVSAPAITVSWMIEHYFPAQQGQLVAMKQATADQVIAVIFNTRHPRGKALAEQFQRALTMVVADGSYLKILQKHLGSEQAALLMQQFRTHSRP